MAAQAFRPATQGQLRDWLEGHGVPTAPYGQGPTKSLKHLLTEVLNGESTLGLDAGGQPQRRVSVVSVEIRDARGRMLIEARQVLPSGAQRARALPLSEKLLPGEAWEAAAVRGVREELASVLPPSPQISIKTESHTMTEDRRPSLSYPGLATCYIRHRVEAEVQGLPSEAFRTEEQRPDGILTAFWEWII